MTLDSGVSTPDLLLGGGTPHVDMFLIVGPAGLGKAPPDLQTAFLTTARGCDAFCAALSGTAPRRLLRNIESFSFRDAGQLGRRLSVLDVDHLIELGPEAVTDGCGRPRVAEKPKW